MITILKHSMPTVLKKYQSDPMATYDSISSTDKDIIKAELINEQHNLCAYCMSRINLNTSTIDHRLPRHPVGETYDRQKSLDYNNMFAVCMCSRGKEYKEQTCDVHKNNMSITINPCDSNDIDKVRYRSNGIIYSNDPKINNDLENTLNLNCDTSSLPQNRKAAIDELHKFLKREIAKGKTKKSICNNIFHSIESKQEYPPFAGIILWQLNKWIV